jgi:hypothetical protein
MTARTPPTYDEIIARTVPDPDSSWRPSAQQRREALERTPPPRDEALAAKVGEVLRELGAEHVSYEVEGDRVILRGAVADPRTWNQIEQAIEQVDGVEELENLMHVG